MVRCAKRGGSGMNLNFRGLDPKIASKIHAHRIEHGHDNLTATLECIIKQWDEQREYGEEHSETLEVVLAKKKGSGRVSK